MKNKIKKTENNKQKTCQAKHKTRLTRNSKAKHSSNANKKNKKMREKKK